MKLEFVDVRCRVVFFYLFHINFVIWYLKPEDHWSCIAHLSAEDMLKSAVIEAGADNPLGPKF